MTNSATRVLEVIQKSPVALTPKAIKDMGIIDTSYVGKVLTGLHRAGKLKRVKVANRGGGRGKPPFAYYTPEDVVVETAPATNMGQVKIMVGDYMLTVAEARSFYDQLSELFSK